MNAGIESTFANHSLIKQLLEPFRLLSRHTPVYNRTIVNLLIRCFLTERDRSEEEAWISRVV